MSLVWAFWRQRVMLASLQVVMSWANEVLLIPSGVVVEPLSFS